MTKKLKHIDTKLLIEVFGTEHEIICEMIDVFTTIVAEYHDEINNRYNSKNWFELGLVAHKAKASCKTMGLRKLGDCLNKIENNAKGIAYNELSTGRNLSEDNEKLYKAMLREGQTSGDDRIIEEEITYLQNNFTEAIDEIKMFEKNIDKYLR